MPSHKYGLPLTPSGDSCRTSRLALRQVALVRPQAVITSVAKEIARYNNLATNAQGPYSIEIFLLELWLEQQLDILICLCCMSALATFKGFFIV